MSVAPDAPHGPVDRVGQLPSKTELTGQLPDVLRAARAASGAVSLLVIDVDYFKSVNDAFGHRRGDRVLNEFVARAQAVLGEGATLYRYGGDEFVVLVRGGIESGRAQATAIFQAVCGTPFAGEPPLAISLSVGVASCPDDASEASALFEAADRRLYVAKRRGRAQVVSEGDATAASEGLNVDTRLIDRDNELEALYRFLDQPGRVERGVLGVLGEPGTGRTRFLREVKNGARLLGYEVVSLPAVEELRGRAFGALVRGRPELLEAAQRGVDAFAQQLWRRAEAAGRPAVLLAIDDLGALDELTLRLVQQLLGSPAVPRLVIAYTSVLRGEAARLGAAGVRSEEIVLRPLAREAFRTWVRTLAHFEPSAEFLSWFYAQTGGLPGNVAMAVERMLREGVLSMREGCWLVDDRFRELDLAGWIDASRRRPPARLPERLGCVYGRDAELDALRGALQSQRLVSLIGPGGIGKTRLAVQAAWELAGGYPDGVFLVQLAPAAGAELVLPAIADALGLTFQAGSAPQQVVFDYLRDRHALLVLDNFEHVTGAAGLVGELLRSAPGLRVLATSRERLALEGEVVFDLGGMALPDAVPSADAAGCASVRFFVHQVRRHTYDFEPSAEELAQIARICRLVDGVPLALELAAAMVRVLDCAELADEIERDIDTLVSASRDAPDRHRSLRAVFEYSWQLLPEPEREVLCRLSVFRGGFRREAAERIAGASLFVLSLLVNKSLLRRLDKQRYEVHEVIRRYAEEKLDALYDGGAVRAEHSRYYAEFVYARGERRPSADLQAALQAVGEEIDNVYAGWAHAVERQDEVAITRYTQGLFRFFDLRGQYEQGAELFGAAAARLADPLTAARLRVRQATFLYRLSQFDAAEALHRQALALFRRLRLREERPLSLFNLGQIAFQAGQHRRAERLQTRALAIWRDLGYEYGIALCTNELGVLHYTRGDDALAEALVRESLAIRERIYDYPGIVRGLNNLALISARLGRGDEVRQAFQRSLTIAREIGDRRGTATALNNLGVFARLSADATGDAALLQEAERHLSAALAVYRDLGSPFDAALAHYNLGDVAFARGDLAAARAHFSTALESAAGIGAVPLLLSVFLGLAKLFLRTGDAALASELLAHAARHPAADEEDRDEAQRLLREFDEVPPAEADPVEFAGWLLARDRVGAAA